MPLTETIQRIERQLKANHYVEAEDIRALVEAYKSLPERLEQSLGIGNEYIISCETKGWNIEYWIEHKQVGSAEPFKQWVESITQN